MTGLLQRCVTDQAEARPEATAVVWGTERITYGGLEAATNRLARVLVAAGCRRGDRVGLLLPKSIPAIVGILGSLKADCAYVPLDPASPAPRVARILDISGARCVLASRPTLRLLGQALDISERRAEVRIGWMDGGEPERDGLSAAFRLEDLSSIPDTALCYANDDRDMAHILFTSGSTGVPKGVMITHANVNHFIGWARGYFGTSPGDRISCHPPLHFDLSTFDIYGTLGAGAELHLVPAELNLLPHKMAQFIRDSGLTQWFSVPSILTHMAKFDSIRQNDFPALTRLLWCGETFPTAPLIHWMRRLPHVSFTNLYGPTEATIASSFYRVPSCPADDRQPIPIGHACDGEELMVLDDALEPVPPGATGQLFIRGVGLSPGYWRDPEKTGAAFLRNPRGPDPSDRIYRTGDLARIGDGGLIYLIGRADTQIKSRGYRIELGEIEAALHAIDGLRECAVVAVGTDAFEGTSICCAYVAAPGSRLTPRLLRRKLAEALPPYMLPSRWLELEGLPQNVNGKVDRPAVRERFQRGEDRGDVTRESPGPATVQPLTGREV